MGTEKIPVLDSDLVAITEYDEYCGDVKEMKSPAGVIVVIEVGTSLGLASSFIFVNGACKANKNPETDTILIDVSKTRNFFDSAPAIIEAFFKKLDYHLKGRVFFINSNSVIKHRLKQGISRSLVFL